VADQYELVQVQRVDEGVEVAGVVGEPVGDVGSAGGAHPDQVRRQGPGLAGDVRGHVAPQVGGGRVAVQEQHGRPADAAGVVGDAGVKNLDGRHDRCLLEQ